LQSQFSVAALNANLTEGASGTTPFTFTVTRGGDASGSGSVAYTIAGNGAAPATAADFVGGAFPGGTVAFVAGETSKTVTVAVLGDAESELDETFTVSLNAPVGGTISGTAATGVIRNDDGGTITGTSGADTLTGSTGNDTMSGLAGNDRIDGGGGVDRITGGLGADRLSGGAMGDTFIFSTLQDSTSALAGRDQISDFAGSLGDRIDLSAIDANSILAGNDAFVLVAADFTGVAGEISMTSWGTTWLVRADVDGDGVADFALTVLSADTLTTTDFIL
jgi:Ca2+-binding RTX toxin-like protein